MAATAYLVARDRTILANRDGKNHTDVMVVNANSSTQAKEFASAVYEGGDASWSTATATPIAAQDLTSLIGWQFRISVLDPAGAEDEIQVNYTAIAADSIDDVGAALVVLLNATDIDGAAYATNTLTVAAGMTDGMGDRRVVMFVAPPGKHIVKSAIPSLVGAITDEGMADADLSIVFPADADAFPVLYGRFADNT